MPFPVRPDRLSSEIGRVQNIGRLNQWSWGTAVPKCAPRHDMRFRRELQRHPRELLDQEHADTLFRQARDDAHEPLHDQGSEAQRHFIREDEFGLAIRACARASICCCPPDMEPALWRFGSCSSGKTQKASASIRLISAAEC